MDFSGDAIIVAAKDQVSCELGGEAAILNINTGFYYGLNALGAFVWKLVQNPQRLSQIQSTVLQEYEVDPEQCERDLASLLESLQEQGLIEVKVGP